MQQTSVTSKQHNTNIHTLVWQIHIFHILTPKLMQNMAPKLSLI